MKKGSPEHKEYMRQYNAAHKEKKRQWMWYKRHGNSSGSGLESGPRTGNDAYKELVLEDKRFLKGAPKCTVCGQRHWPMRMDLDLGVRPEDHLMIQ